MPEERADALPVRMTWLGTNSFKVETPKLTFLVDPFVTLPGAQHSTSLDDFAGVETVLITHGHFDHLSSVPDLLARNLALVLCTECCTESLVERDVPADLVVTIAPGDEFDLDDVTVRVFQGRHITFDKKLVFDTLRPSNMRRAKGNIPALLDLIRSYPEENQTVLYDMDLAELHVQIMGSLALAEEVDYPTGADYLILPYQGNSQLRHEARRVLERLKPRNVILSHFDDAFPPVSQRVPISGFESMMAVEYPQVGLIIPSFNEPFELNRD